MLKLFQRSLFACFTKDFFTFEVSVYFDKFEISNIVVGCCQGFPAVLRFWPPYMNEQILLGYEIRQSSRFFRKF